MKIVLKIVACWAAFVVSLILAGIAVGILHLRPMAAPPGMTPSGAMLGAALAGAVLVAGVTPLAMGLRGSRDRRGAALFVFLLLALGVNGLLEARAFMHGAAGAAPAWIVMAFVEALVLGVALALSFGANGRGAGAMTGGWQARALRVLGAWLGFFAIWWAFGLCVVPFVRPAYEAGVAGLFIPSFGVIAETELLRSILFLMASLPLIALWGGSRLRLWLTLGLAHATVVGYYGLVQASFLPQVLRVAHSLEITADSFAYAGLLVLLFAARPGAEEPARAPEPAKEIHAQ